VYQQNSQQMYKYFTLNFKCPAARVPFQAPSRWKSENHTFFQDPICHESPFTSNHTGYTWQNSLEPELHDKCTKKTLKKFSSYQFVTSQHLSRVTIYRQSHGVYCCAAFGRCNDWPQLTWQMYKIPDLSKFLTKKWKIPQNPSKSHQKCSKMTKFMQKRVKKNPWYRVKRVSEKLNFSQKVDKKLKEIEKFHEKKSYI